MAPRWEPLHRPISVSNIISVARAPSTLSILSFLQEIARLHCRIRGTLFHTQGICGGHHCISRCRGQPICRNDQVVKFLRRARILNSPCPHTVLTSDLSTILRARRGPPFDLLQSVDLWPLTLNPLVSEVIIGSLRCFAMP